MPSKKRKYNARFPAGRIKKIMQTDEEVGKVAQAVPIIISRTLELFVESLLGKALQVTLSRNAKTLSPSHVKQCILSEARFDFLRDLVNNIPDVSAAEEKELNGEGNSPTSTRFPEPPPTRRVLEESAPRETRAAPRRKQSIDKPPRKPETTATITSAEAIDLTKKEPRLANFYQETLPDDTYPSVIQLNPSYAQPSTSGYVTPPAEVRLPKPDIFAAPLNNNTTPPVAPVINIDFTKNIAKPEIKVLDTAVAGIVGVRDKRLPRQYSKSKLDVKSKPATVVSADFTTSSQLDDDYDT